MRLPERYAQLSTIGKLGVWSSVAGIIGVLLVPLGWLLEGGSVSGRANVATSQVEGDNNVVAGRDVTINRGPKYRSVRVLDNDGSPTLVLKSFPEDRDFIRHAMKPANQTGLAEVG